MARSLPSSDEQGLERVIGMLLRAGLALAALLVAVGAALYLARHGAELADYRVFRGEPAELRSPSGIVDGALALGGRSLIELGLSAELTRVVADPRRPLHNLRLETEIGTLDAELAPQLERLALKLRETLGHG